MTVKMKRGRLSWDEMRFIEKNVKTLGAEAVANKLNRSIENITSYALKKGIAFDDKIPEEDIVGASIAERLQNSPNWNLMKKQFSKEELDYFINQYVKYTIQFQDGLFATEESQLLQLIRFEILNSRAMIEAKTCKDDVAYLQKMLSDLYIENENISPVPDAVLSRINNLEAQINALRSAGNVKVAESVKIQEKISSISREMKGTRDQRIERIESSKQTWTALLKALEEDEFRAREGRQMELLRMAVKKEEQKLADFHEYMDGALDRPLLNAETIEYVGEKKNDES